MVSVKIQLQVAPADINFSRKLCIAFDCVPELYYKTYKITANPHTNVTFNDLYQIILGTGFPLQNLPCIEIKTTKGPFNQRMSS